MSCIATFYLLPENKRPEFVDAHRNEKTVTYKKTLFGKKEVITGERYLWEYLDEAATQNNDLPFSGFALVDYLFICTTLPEPLAADLSAAEMGEHYTVFSAELARNLADYLERNAPTAGSLGAFAAKEWPDRKDSAEYGQTLRKIHDHFVGWLRSVTLGNFAVLHLSF